MTTYAITAVTGRFGRAAVAHLATLVPAGQIIALARNVEAAKNIVPEGVVVRPGDYTKPEELAASLEGVDRLLFISSQPGAAVPRDRQHANVVEAAQKAWVRFIAYTSFPRAQTANVPLAADHKLTEDLIVKSGIAHSFLRNNWYFENEAATINAAKAGNDFVYSAGAGRAGWALEREYAAAAATVLAADGIAEAGGAAGGAADGSASGAGAANTKEVYEFSGPARTYAEIAAAIPGDFAVRSVDDSAYQAGLQAAGLDEGTAALITSFQSYIRDGVLDETSSDLAEVLGHDLTPLADAIKEV